MVDDGWWLVLRGAPAAADEGAPAAAVRMRFEGARAVTPEAVDPAPGAYNWLRGPDPAHWVRGARSYERVVWLGLREGLDLVAHAGDPAAVFEYDLELAPGADLDGFRVAVEGHEGLRVDDEGRLVVETAVGPLVQPPPRAWQLRGDAPQSFPCRFRVLDEAHFGLEAPARDPALAAVVDPALLFSTYLSGQLQQTIEAVAPGPAESTYVGGWTVSDDFPSSPGAFQEFTAGLEDVFVTRLNGDGTQLVWSTFVGGDDLDILGGMAVDAAGAATLCGQTRSLDYPTLPDSFDPTPNGFVDGFVSRLAPSGDALIWSTYLGGGLNDFCNDVALDATGAATVVGATNGSGFPVLSGFDLSFNGGVFAGDAFVTRVANDGKSLVWSTYLGGSQDDGADVVAVEATGEVSVAGSTSGGFPVNFGAFDNTFSAPADTWVARLTAAGNGLVYATYFSNVPDTAVHAIALDGTGEAELLGRTEDPGFPLTPGAFRTAFDGGAEGFYARLAANGGSLVRSTFIGGNGDDDLVGLARDPSGRVILAGNTTSDDMPTTPGAYDPAFNDSLGGVFSDVFVLRFDTAVSAVDYGTYFGTPSTDTTAGVGLDATGAVVLAGNTNSFQFPTTAGALQESFNLTAAGQGFAARLNFLLHPIVYGAQSQQGAAQISWTGFPGLNDPFAIQIQGATPNFKAILFHGFASQSSPFYGRTIFVLPPLYRHRPVLPDSFGYKSQNVQLNPAWVGQNVYFQWWYKDPSNPKKKTGLSNALQVLVHP